MRSHSTKKINRKLVLEAIDRSMPTDEQPGQPIKGAGLAQWAADITDRTNVGACGYQAIFEELEKLLEEGLITYGFLRSPDGRLASSIGLGLRRMTDEEQRRRQENLEKEAKRSRIIRLRTARNRHGGIRRLPVADRPASLPQTRTIEELRDYGRWAEERLLTDWRTWYEERRAATASAA